MDRRRLGHSGIEVSRLCYGTLSFCTAQADLSPEQGGDLLLYAQSLGVDFFDTAEIYGTYPHIRHAVRHSVGRPVVCSKTYAWDRAGAAASVDRARREMDLDVIDLDVVEPQVEAAQVVEEEEGYRRAVLCRNDYFMAERIELDAGSVLHGTCNGDTLEIWGAIDGRAEINDLDLPAVRFALLPASLGDYAVRAVSPATLLRTYTPPSRPWLDEE
mgnify:CR=1 FL=1